MRVITLYHLSFIERLINMKPKKLSSGNYRTQVVVGKDENGKTHCKVVYCRNGVAGYKNG